MFTVKATLYSATALDTDINGSKIKGSSIYIGGDKRVPQKVFINNNVDVANTLISYLADCDDSFNPPVECDVDINGKKVIYHDIRPLKKK